MWLFFLILLGLLWLSAVGWTDKLEVQTDRSIVVWTLVPYFIMLLFPFFFPNYFLEALGILVLYLVIGLVFFIDETIKFKKNNP